MKKLLPLLMISIFLTGCAADTTVYITKTGSKYHRANCTSLYYSKIEIKLDKALNDGYEPCGICKP